MLKSIVQQLIVQKAIGFVVFHFQLGFLLPEHTLSWEQTPESSWNYMIWHFLLGKFLDIWRKNL